LQQQIDGDSFHGVDRLHSSKLVEHRTEEMAHGDLVKYHAALDQALMRFHQMKMDEVNKLISEYWQQTYRGRDIDTIKIVSDVESEKLTRRSYNYRVVMRKNDVEIDMRGRCSSGQKVLACLVIRLALAESFCTSCGILALDEPTTNLDHDNIMSLAQALGRIIEARRGNSHFQLIIIRCSPESVVGLYLSLTKLFSHDEEFMSLLARESGMEQYYRCILLVFLFSSHLASHPLFFPFLNQNIQKRWAIFCH
jgi:DNA repair protein RAD50